MGKTEQDLLFLLADMRRLVEVEKGSQETYEYGVGCQEVFLRLSYIHT